jgi:molybdopterin converting factor small subunit
MSARRSSLATITVIVSSPLRDFCGGAAEIRLRAGDLRGVLEELERGEPRLHRAVCDETGRVRRHVNLFVNELHMSELGGLEATLVSGDVITILPAVSGGQT